MSPTLESLAVAAMQGRMLLTKMTFCGGPSGGVRKVLTGRMDDNRDLDGYTLTYGPVINGVRHTLAIWRKSQPKST